MKDKKLRKMFFGRYDSLGKINERSYTLTFPPKDDDDKRREIRYSGDDGIILYLLKRIEKLEEQKSLGTNKRSIKL